MYKRALLLLVGLLVATPTAGGRFVFAQEQFRAPDPNESPEVARARAMVEELVEFGLRTAKGMTTTFDYESSAVAEIGAFESALSRLHAYASSASPRGGSVDRHEALREIAARAWSSRDSETPRAMLDRLEAQSAKWTGSPLPGIKARYELVSGGAPWPLEWRNKKAHWLDFAATLVATKTGREPITRWRELAAAHPDRADLCRQAYLAVAEVRAEGPLDAKFLEPLLLAEEISDGERLVRIALVLRAAIAAGHRADDEYRASLGRRLFESAPEVADRLWPYNYKELAVLAQIVPRDEPEWHELEAKLLESATPASYSYFAGKAGFSVTQRYQRFLAKPVEVGYAVIELKDVVADLADRVDLPLWIDAAALEETATVSLERRGRWLDVMTAVLEGTPYELVMLRDDLFWLGPRAARDGAAALLRESLARFPPRGDAGDSPLREVLLEPTRLEFIDTPLTDVVEYLEDLHGMRVDLLGERRYAVLTMRVRRVPLHLALQLIGEEIVADWCADGPVLTIGSPEEIKQYRRMLEDYRLKLARLAGRRDPLAEKLAENTELEFVRTRLSDVLAHLDHLHGGVPFEFAREADGAVLVTRGLRDVPLGWALEETLFRHGLTWEDAEGKLVIKPRATAPKTPDMKR